MATHPDEHLLIYELNHAARALALLLRQHVGKARIEAFVCALAAGAQCQEDLLWSIIIGATTVQGSEGAHLDRWGKIIGERRGGLVNADYRRFIDLRITVNNDIPNEDEVYQAIASAVYPSTVTVFELTPHGRQYIVRSEEFVSDVILAHTSALIRDFRPAGVIVPIVETVPVHFALDWEDGGSVIDDGAGAGDDTHVVSRLIYSGRGPG